MTSKTAQLNELIAITRDGQRFYEHAREEVRDTQLKSLFAAMSRSKTEVIQALSSSVAANNEQPTTDGTFFGKLREVYADTRAVISIDQEATYVSQLEEAEDRILHAFKDAIEDADPELKAVLNREMPKVRACHDQMRSLKRAV